MATLLRGLDNDVFFQVGLLTTIGLSAKNAILIVEFAKENYDAGVDLIESVVRAAHQRLRPILMTSLAFILGVMPLAISTGAGSGGQNAIGTGVIGGMISATFLAIFFVPVFFVFMLRLFRVPPWRPRSERAGAAAGVPPLRAAGRTRAGRGAALRKGRNYGINGIFEGNFGRGILDGINGINGMGRGGSGQEGHENMRRESSRFGISSS